MAFDIPHSQTRFFEKGIKWYTHRKILLDWKWTVQSKIKNTWSIVGQQSQEPQWLRIAGLPQKINKNNQNKWPKIQTGILSTTFSWFWRFITAMATVFVIIALLHLRYTVLYVIKVIWTRKTYLMIYRSSSSAKGKRWAGWISRLAGSKRRQRREGSCRSSRATRIWWRGWCVWKNNMWSSTHRYEVHVLTLIPKTLSDETILFF